MFELILHNYCQSLTGSLINVFIFLSCFIAIIQEIVKRSWKLAVTSVSSWTKKFCLSFFKKAFFTCTQIPQIFWGFLASWGFLILISKHVDGRPLNNDNKSSSVLCDQIGSIVVKNASYWSKIWEKKMLFSVSEQSFKNYLLSSRTSVKDEKNLKKRLISMFIFSYKLFPCVLSFVFGNSILCNILCLNCSDL